MWNSGDRKPLDNPMITDVRGRGWRWDPDLLHWIHERSDGHIAASYQSWELLTSQHGPLSER